MSATALIRIGQLVTVAGPPQPRTGPAMRDLGMIRNGGLLIRNGRIERTGPSDEIAAAAEELGAEIVDAEEGVVLPGFVDAHAHPVFGGQRLEEFEQRAAGASYEEIAASGGGIRSTVKQTRAATEEELLAQARKHAGWFLQGGTTTVEAKSGYGLSLEAELKILRVIRALNQESDLEFVPTFLGAHAVPDEFRGTPERYVELITEEMLPAVAAEHLAEYCDAFCEAGYFDLATTRRVLQRARDLGLGLRLHADQLTDSGGARLAAELRTQTADHLEQTEIDGIRALAAAGVQPVLLPGSVYALSKTRYPRARAMIEEGLAVVLATDFNPGSSPTTSMPMVMSLAVTQMKMLPAEALVAATINAAWSLQRGDRLGSLEPGKQADFTLFECADYREIIYYFGTSFTRAVFKQGQRVFAA